MAVSGSITGEDVARVPRQPGVLEKRSADAETARALAFLDETYRRPLVDFCRRLTGSPDDAEDLASEALLRAARKLPTFKPRHANALRSWLFQIALNLARDRLRRRERERKALSHMADLPAPRPPSPEQQALWTVLDALPFHLRAAVLLRLRYQFDYDEIARVLRCRPSTARWRVHKALQTLAELMSDEA